MNEQTDADARRLGETMNRLRIGQRLSQADLARLSKVSRGTISNIERAYDPTTKRPPRPHPDTLRLVADGLATDGRGVLHVELRDRFYAELMVAAGYDAAVFEHLDPGDTALIRTEAEAQRWLAEQLGDPDLAVAWARVVTERRFLSPADQVGLDAVIRLFRDRLERNQRDPER